jgi:hypothetical protein
MASIACIGWGSLIPNPGNLIYDGIWREDGPMLPVEFVRESDSKRLTLVIFPTARLVPTLWTKMTCATLDEAKESLRRRERFSRNRPDWIGCIELTGAPQNSVEASIKKWAAEKSLDAAIWANNSPKFNGTNGVAPNIDEAVEYLRQLEPIDLANAEDYIRTTPTQVRTLYRERFEQEFGWTPISN